MGDASDDGFDGADRRGSGFVVDDRAPFAILLVVDGESGGSAALEKGGFVKERV